MLFLLFSWLAESISTLTGCELEEKIVSSYRINLFMLTEILKLKNNYKTNTRKIISNNNKSTQKPVKGTSFPISGGGNG